LARLFDFFYSSFFIKVILYINNITIIYFFKANKKVYIRYYIYYKKDKKRDRKRIEMKKCEKV